MRIDPEFKAIIPPMSSDTYSRLEASIRNEGCRDALVLWGDILVDGHNRLAICTEHGIPYRTVPKEFASRDEAINWIIDNQLARRNITSEERTYLIGLRYRNEKKQVGAPEGNQNRTFQIAQSEPFVSAPSKAQSEPSISTADRIAQQQGVSRETVKRAERFADGLDAIASVAPEIKTEILQGKSEFTKAEVTSYANIPDEEVVARIEEKRNPHVSNNSGNNEWYTPKEYIDMARAVMGTIDCDPASSDIANETVEAETYFTAEENGLEQEWIGNVWMNPPYAQPLIQQFAEKLTAEIDNGNVMQACVLVNNATETQWFQTMARKASAVWFIKGRIKFLDIHGNANGAPLQGQCILYFGESANVFIQNCAGLVCACQYV